MLQYYLAQPHISHMTATGQQNDKFMDTIMPVFPYGGLHASPYPISQFRIDSYIFC